MAIDGGVVLRQVAHGGHQSGRRPEIRGRIGGAQHLAVAVVGVGLGDLRQGLAIAVEVGFAEHCPCLRIVDDVGPRHAVSHRQRLEEGIDELHAQRLPGRLLEDGLEVLEAVGVVAELLAGRAFGGVAEQVLDPDAVVLDLGHVARHRRVEVELALLDELQHEDRRERLGDRGDVVKRVRRRGHATLHVRVAEALGPEHLAVLENRGRKAGNLQPLAIGFELLAEAIDTEVVRLGRGRFLRLRLHGPGADQHQPGEQRRRDGLGCVGSMASSGQAAYSLKLRVPTRQNGWNYAGAPGRNRTCMALRPTDFKSVASTRSATGARSAGVYRAAT